jgi:adenosylcobyric acid synthase
LPTETLFKASKTLRQVWALEESSESAAYEIHMGETRSLSATASLHQVRDEHGFRSEGMQCANVWGTYLHGWFDSPAARRRVARAAGIHAHQAHPIPWAEQRQQTYREMARHLEAHVSLDPVKRYLGI